MIKIDNLAKIFRLGDEDFYALSNISFDISKGLSVALVGHSGSGKTTLLNIIGLIENCSTGKYYFDGEDTSLLSEKKLQNIRLNKIGFIFQDFYLLDYLNVYENIEYPLMFAKNYDYKTRKTIIEDMATNLGISKQLYQKIKKLSGGQKQRVAIARALINSPSLIVADEFSSNLDNENVGKCMELIMSLKDKIGSTLVFATHDPRVISYADKVIQLSDGRINEKI